LVFAVQQRDCNGAGIERIVVAKVVIPTSALVAMRQSLLTGKVEAAIELQGALLN
jgi:hypothetical protein